MLVRLIWTGITIIAMAFSLTPRQLLQAKEAIEMLSNLTGSEGQSTQSAVSAVTTTRQVVPPPQPASQQPSGRASISSNEARDVLSAANRCLLSMNQLKPEPGRKRKAKEEVSSLFGKRKKNAAKCVWKHKFICLADCNQKRIPTTDTEKDVLLMAGLGEKEIEFYDLELPAGDFRDLLYHHFPTLQEGGGFQFFKCRANSRSLEQLSSTTLSSPSMLKSRVGNSRTYIRPMQRNLDLTPIVELPGGATEKCLTCGQMFGVEQLASHLDVCGIDTRDTECDGNEDGVIDLTATDHDKSPSSSCESGDDDRCLPPAPITREYCSSHFYDITENQSIEDEMIGAAIGDSLHIDCGHETTGTSSAEIVRNETLGSSASLVNEIKWLQKNIDYDSTLHIEVRRNFVLSDALREARKNKFNPKKFIKVTFVGEGAIDQGGPKREFFRLFADQASTYFRGDDGQPKFLRNDILAVQKNDFFNIGVYLVLSIVYGGKGFPFLAEPVFDYLSVGHYSVTVPEEEIPDALLKLIVTKLRCAKNNNDICEIFELDEAIDLLYLTGYSKPTSAITLADRDEIVNGLMEYHLMAKVKTEMDQLKSGLDTFCFLEKMKNNPAMWKPYFINTKIKLSAESIKGLFKVHYSKKESRLRPKEEEAYIFFADFLDECEENELDCGCSLEDILIFFSGTDTVPPLEFYPTIVFSHGDVLPTASTCDLELRIPATHSEYTKFRDAMVLGLKGHDGFGGI